MVRNKRVLRQAKTLEDVIALRKEKARRFITILKADIVEGQAILKCKQIIRHK